MKLTHKLCGAALVAVAGLALVAPSTAKAESVDATTFNGKGHIKFSSSTGKPIVTDPGSTTGTLTNTDITDPGDFGIIFVTPLEFGEHDYLATQSDTTFDVELYEEEGGVSTQNFVSYQDFRAQANHSYSLQAKVLDTFKDGANVLKGVTMEYKNTWLWNNGANVALNPTAPKATVTLTASDTGAGDAEIFINNAETDGKGFGRYDLNFGEKAKADTDPGVILTVPTTNSRMGDFTATIQWTLGDAE